MTLSAKDRQEIQADIDQQQQTLEQLGEPLPHLRERHVDRVAMHRAEIARLVRMLEAE